jgi:hypothetical protein
VNSEDGMSRYREAQSYDCSHIDTEVVSVATKPATPATMTAALPIRVPVPEGPLAYASMSMAMTIVFLGRVQSRQKKAAKQLQSSGNAIS